MGRARSSGRSRPGGRFRTRCARCSRPTPNCSSSRGSNGAARVDGRDRAGQGLRGEGARLAPYLRAPGDGRDAPVVPAADLLWALLAGYLLRDGAFHAVEALVHSPARRALGVRRPFGDDTLGYFTERLEVAETRAGARHGGAAAKRHKAFDDVLYIGLVLDGTTVGRCPTVALSRLSPDHRAAPGDGPAPPDAAPPIGQVVGQHHKLSLLTVVGGDLVLPLDVEPYPAGDTEQAASLRLLARTVARARPPLRAVRRGGWALRDRPVSPRRRAGWGSAPSSV